MKHRDLLLRTGAAAAALMLCLGSASAEEAQTAATETNVQAQGDQNQNQQGVMAFNRVRVVAGYDLIGKPVRDNDGMLVGEVEYLFIDPATGKVANVIVGPGKTLSEKYEMEGLRAIPWNAFATDFSNSGEVRTLALQIGKKELEAAPMVNADAIEALTTRQFMARVRDYYLPILPQSKDQAAKQGEQQAEANQSSPDAQAGQDDQAQSSQTQSSSNAQAEQDDQAQSSQTQSSSIAQTGEDSAAMGEQSGSNGYVLVGRAVVTALAPPDFRLADQLRGANVVGKDGKELGEIERLLIDVERGHVAYALISRGGFLGMGEELRAVPIQALRWQNGETFSLDVSAQQFAQMPRIVSTQMPQRVRRTDIEKLYQAFDIQPYWNMAG